MKRQWIHYILFILGAIILLYACANPVGSLSGGDKDTQPPGIDSLKSTPTPSLNFNEKEIRLTFDEWIKLEDAFNQVVVSPPLEYRPEIKLKGKSVVITFDDKEQLRDSTTYIVNFGDAVKDLTEGNIPPNLKFVLSTGNELDSLETTGQIFDTESGKGEANVLVMLYKNMADSVVSTEKPFYFSKTDKDGKFKIDFLKAGTYKAAALVDNNFNYLFDLPNEKIGFLEEPVVITDTGKVSLVFKIFEEEQALAIIDNETRQQGVLKFIFNKPPKGIVVNEGNNFNNPIFTDISKDSLLLWYSDTLTGEERIIILSNDKEEFNDTIRFNIPEKKNKLPFGYASNLKRISLSPKDSLVLNYNQPIGNINTDSISVTVDSLDYTGKISARILDNKRKVIVDFESEESKKYTFNILPSAITDIYGNIPKDTLELEIEALALSEFGDLNINIVFPDSSIQYIVEFQNPKGEELDKYEVSNVSSFNIFKQTLAIGKYKIRVTEDINSNGRKDSGSYDDKRQPERIFEKALEGLKKNFTSEVEVNVVF